MGILGQIWTESRDGGGGVFPAFFKALLSVTDTGSGGPGGSFLAKTSTGSGKGLAMLDFRKSFAALAVAASVGGMLGAAPTPAMAQSTLDRKSTRLNSSHTDI